MKNENARIVGWVTTKTAKGYTFRVRSIGYQVETLTLKTGTLPTRARAVTRAKQWIRYFRHHGVTTPEGVEALKQN